MCHLAGASSGALSYGQTIEKYSKLKIPEVWSPATGAFFVRFRENQKYSNLGKLLNQEANLFTIRETFQKRKFLFLVEFRTLKNANSLTSIEGKQIWSKEKPICGKAPVIAGALVVAGALVNFFGRGKKEIFF